MKYKYIDGNGCKNPLRYEINLYTIEQIKEFCMEYDKLVGTWPETVYQGCSVYNFILAKTTDNLDNFDMYSEWKKEL